MIDTLVACTGLAGACGCGSRSLSAPADHASTVASPPADGAADGDGSAAQGGSILADATFEAGSERLSSDGSSGDALSSPHAEAGTDAMPGSTSEPDASSVGCPPGMVRIAAKGQTFTMGLDSSDAPLQSNGLPWSCYLGVHQVTFTYDFCMDAHLVTQSEFVGVMGFNPSKHQESGDAGATLPVDSETWFDAMIYCNTKSQAAGLEPAYSYGTVTHSANGAAYGGGPTETTDPRSTSSVADVVMDLTQPGYRLPTNAEYEYAERADTTGLYFFTDSTDSTTVSQIAQLYGWDPDNSEGMTHPVGLLKPNPWNLYDIVGDLFEWENDWDAPYSTAPQVDPVGADAGSSCSGQPQPGGAKMAKGGSFRADPGNHMRIGYHYFWTPASINVELGFRCVATAP